MQREKGHLLVVLPLLFIFMICWSMPFRRTENQAAFSSGVIICSIRYISCSLQHWLIRSITQPPDIPPIQSMVFVRNTTMARGFSYQKSMFPQKRMCGGFFYDFLLCCPCACCIINPDIFPHNMIDSMIFHSRKGLIPCLVKLF